MLQATVRQLRRPGWRQSDQSRGKLSSKGPRTPFGYQMKCPIPSDAKFSPAFHEVSPATVPAHSFCQIFFPIRNASARDSSIASRAQSCHGRPQSARNRRRHGVAVCHLDAASFSSSVHTSAAWPALEAALLLEIIYEKFLHFPAAHRSRFDRLFPRQPTQLKDEKDKVSYSIGLDIGSTFKKQSMDINIGCADGRHARWHERQQASADRGAGQGNDDGLLKNHDGKTSGASQGSGAKNAAAGEKFLAENKTKEGVKTTASGLQYKVLKEGSGDSPKETDTVVTQLQGHADQRHGIRQFLQAQ